MQENKMTDIELMYSYLRLHPEADNAQLMENFGWDSAKVRTYKYRLKKQKYIAIDKEEGKDVIVFLKDADIDMNKESDTAQFRQDCYRDLAEAYLERIHDAGTNNQQMIDLGRELRLILKEMV